MCEIFANGTENCGRIDEGADRDDARDVVRVCAESVEVGNGNEDRAMCTPETREQKKKRLMRTVVGLSIVGACREGEKRVKLSGYVDGDRVP